MGIALHLLRETDKIYIDNRKLYREEMPRESTEPEMRGPLDLTQETVEVKIADPEVSSVDHILRFLEKMEALMSLVQENRLRPSKLLLLLL